MRTIYITEADFYDFDCGNCITYNLPLYNKLHDENIRVGESLHLLVEERNLYCDVLIENIEYGDGTIWVKFLGDNE